MTKIQAEIDKCIVLCANCHAIRHYNMLNKDKNGSGVAPWLEKFLTSDPEVAEELEKITRHLASSSEDTEASGE